MSFLSKFKKKEQEASSQKNSQQLPPQADPLGNLNKPKEEQKVHIKGKPGGGWDDEDDSFQLPQQQKGKPNFLQVKKQPEQKNQDLENSKAQDPSQQSSTVQQIKQQQGAHEEEKKIPAEISKEEKGKTKTNKVSEIQTTKIIKFKGEFDLLEGEQLATENIQFENKLVNDAIQLGGAKLRQAESQINEFLKACLTLQPQVICSILFSKLHMQINSVMKIRTLFVMQELAKKQPNYQRFFLHHLSIIENSQIPSDEHTNNFKRELLNLITLIKDPSAQISQAREIQFNFNKTGSLNVEKQKQPEDNLLDIKDEKEKPVANHVDHQPANQQQSNTKLNSFDFMKKSKQDQQPPSSKQSEPQNDTNLLDLAGENQQPAKQINAFSFINKKKQPDQQSSIMNSQKQIEQPQHQGDLLQDINFMKTNENNTDNSGDQHKANGFKPADNYQYLNNMAPSQNAPLNQQPVYMNNVAVNPLLNSNSQMKPIMPGLNQNIYNPQFSQQLLLQQQQQLYMQNMLLQNQLLYQQQLIQQPQFPANKSVQLNPNLKPSNLPQEKKEDPREAAFDFIKLQ